MYLTVRPGLVVLLFFVLLAAACGAERSLEAAAESGALAAETSPLGDSESHASHAGPARVFYDLTVFDWYRRGEPLLLDGRAYRPASQPKFIPAETLRQVDSFGGVDVYRRANQSEPLDSIFVPVYENYWLVFTPMDHVRAAH